MLAVLPLAITNAMVTSSAVAEPDTGLGETSWSSSEMVAAGSERIIASPTATVTISQASPAVVTWTANGLAVGAAVVFTNSGGALPTGITSGTTYYVNSRLTADTFTLKDADGRAINTTGAGSGTHTGTAKVHKVYRAAIGYTQATVSAVDTGTERLTVTNAASLFTVAQPVIFGVSGGSLPSPLVAGTLYYIRSTHAPDEFTITTSTDGSGAAVNLATTGSGTISIYYVSASVGPNYNRAPMIETSYWTEVASTNKWSMFDAAVSSKTQATTTIGPVAIVPGAPFDTAAFLGLENATSIDLRHEINRATCTMSIASPCVVTMNSHGRPNNEEICFTTTGALPTGVTAGTTYYTKNVSANTFEISLTAGGASINTSGSQSGTHTAGTPHYRATLDATSGLPYVTNILSEANRSSATYYNGTLFATITGTGTVKCSEMIVGSSMSLGDTVDEISTSLKNYTVFTEDAFGTITKTIRGYARKLRCNVLILDQDISIDSITAFLAENKDEDMLLIATDGLDTHVLYGPILDWEMSSPSEDYKVLRITAQGLTAT